MSDYRAGRRELFQSYATLWPFDFAPTNAEPPSVIKAPDSRHMVEVTTDINSLIATSANLQLRYLVQVVQDKIWIIPKVLLSLEYRPGN